MHGRLNREGERKRLVVVLGLVSVSEELRHEISMLRRIGIFLFLLFRNSVVGPALIDGGIPCLTGMCLTQQLFFDSIHHECDVWFMHFGWIASTLHVHTSVRWIFVQCSRHFRLFTLKSRAICSFFYLCAVPGAAPAVGLDHDGATHGPGTGVTVGSGWMILAWERFNRK